MSVRKFAKGVVILVTVAAGVVGIFGSAFGAVATSPGVAAPVSVPSGAQVSGAVPVSTSGAAGSDPSLAVPPEPATAATATAVGPLVQEPVVPVPVSEVLASDGAASAAADLGLPGIPPAVEVPVPLPPSPPPIPVPVPPVPAPSVPVPISPVPVPPVPVPISPVPVPPAPVPAGPQPGVEPQVPQAPALPEAGVPVASVLLAPAVQVDPVPDQPAGVASSTTSAFVDGLIPRVDAIGALFDVLAAANGGAVSVRSDRGVGRRVANDVSGSECAAAAGSGVTLPASCRGAGSPRTLGADITRTLASTGVQVLLLGLVGACLVFLGSVLVRRRGVRAGTLHG
jgi:hypothetical protein